MKSWIIGIYSVFIGISVIAMWIMILITETPPEGKTELSFHLVSEFLMAFICLVSGILMLRKTSYAVLLNIMGLGMVIYSVINAAGYYGERNDTKMTIMLLLILVFTLAVTMLHFEWKNTAKV